MWRTPRHPSGRTPRRPWLAAFVVAIAIVLAPAATLGQGTVKTLEEGKLQVGFNGDMPMTGEQDGQLIGSDGEMISLIAQNLGLEIQPQQADWAALIESTQSGRLDLMLGAMGWTEERSKVMCLTDPIYYFGTLLAQKTENNWSTFADMAGKKVGTVTGFTLVPELKAIPGIGEVKLYDTSDGVMRDLVTGRLDVAILDPPLVSLAIKEHPDWDLHQVALQPDPAYPIMSTVYNVIMGVNINEPELCQAISTEIGRLWASCTNQQLMAKYGVSELSYFAPPNPSPRIGVDRDEGWVSPTLPAKCTASPASPAAGT